MTSVVERVREELHEEREAYAAGADRPVGALTVLAGSYLVAVATGALLLRGRRRLPDRVRFGDLAVLSVATHKLSRMLAKDSVTAPLRAPFTQLEGSAGHGELNERVRGTGMRKALGELVTCPFCLAVWVATAFMFAYVVAPRLTRLAAMALTAVTASDVLQFEYTRLKERDN